MSEARNGKSQRFENWNLARRVRQMVISAHNMGNAHQGIIDHDRKVVGRIPVGPENDQIVHDSVVEDDISLDEVLNHRPALLRGLESKRSVFGRTCDSQLAAAAVVARREAFGFRFFSPSLQLFSLAHTPIRMPRLKQLHGMAAIQIHPFRLAEWPLVPIEADPLHAREDGLNRFIRRATLIGIFNAKDKHTLLLTRKEPIEQSRAHSSYVEKPRRTGGKPDANLTHDSAVPSSHTTG